MPFLRTNQSYLLTILLYLNQSFKSLFQEYKRRTGHRLEYCYRSDKSLNETVQRDPNDLTSIILLEAERGEAVVGSPDTLANELWPEWKPVRAAEAIIDCLSRDK